LTYKPTTTTEGQAMSDFIVIPTASKVARVANEIVQARVADQAYRLAHLSCADRYAAVENTLVVWAKDDNTVVASVANTPDGHLFGYMVVEVLEDAAFRAGVPFDTAVIDHEDRAIAASLTWS
jgi:hypothetical protein